MSSVSGARPRLLTWVFARVMLVNFGYFLSMGIMNPVLPRYIAGPLHGSPLAVGFGAASLIRCGEASSAVVNLVILPMAFLSGSFGPTQSYPEVLQKVADVLPLTYLIDLLEGAYLHGQALTHDLEAVGILAAWGIAGYVVAAKRFGWQPRER